MSYSRNWRSRFLKAMRDEGNVRAACDASGVSRQYVYALRKRSPAFAAEWDTALEEAVDLLEAEAWKRAQVGTSDTLLQFLLKAHRREFYGDRTRVDLAVVREEAAKLAAEFPELDQDEIMAAAKEMLGVS